MCCGITGSLRALQLAFRAVSRTVLLVEDVAELRATVRQALTLHGGFEVLDAADGESAVAAAEAHQPDTVVVDLGLPDLTGTELVARMRAVVPEARIVVFTGMVTFDRAAIIPRVDAFVHKDQGIRYLVGLISDLGRPVRNAATIELGPELTDLAIARRFLVERCNEWGCDGAVGDGLLVMSELVTNALVHVGSQCELRASFTDGVLRLEVHDSGPGAPDLQSPQRDREGGRGLVIVSSLCRAWGVDAEPDGKVVWSEIPVVSGAA